MPIPKVPPERKLPLEPMSRVIFGHDYRPGSSRIGKAVKDRIAPMLAYLHRLKARIDFLPDDPLYVLVTDARESLHSLWVELSCSGVGRRSG